jgi:hypothetical protein
MKERAREARSAGKVRARARARARAGARVGARDMGFTGRSVLTDTWS